jgi:iron complex transport system ATP-binding protein
MIHFKQTQIGYLQTICTINELKLEAGKVYALLGLNGAGKSTLLKSMAAQLPLLGGELLLNEYPVAQLRKDAALRARQISFVASHFDGVEHLQVQDYIGLGRLPYANSFGRLSSLDEQEVRQVMELLNIQHLAHKETRALSDGERQMVSLARAFVQDTPILLLDEPASYLDFLNRENLLLSLLSWAKQSNKCVVLSSHDIDLCLEHQLPILALAGGQIHQLLDLPKKEVLSILLKWS